MAVDNCFVLLIAVASCWWWWFVLVDCCGLLLVVGCRSLLVAGVVGCYFSCIGCCVGYRRRWCSWLVVVSWLIFLVCCCWFVAVCWLICLGCVLVVG